MEQGLSKELATELKRHISESEDWLIKRILYYAKKQGYSAYTSTLEEAWRASIVGLSKPILDTPVTSFRILELHPHSEFMNDPYALFGVEEARKHRARGIDLIMFMGLFKYYRQTYEDLLFKIGMELEDVKNCRTFLKRYFDKVELGFLDEWVRMGGEEINTEMAKANIRLTNEKSMYLTILESLKHPVVVTNSSGDPLVMNQAAAELFEGYSTPGGVHYKGQKPELNKSVSVKVKEFLKDYNESMEQTHVIDDKIFVVTYTRMKDVSGKFIGIAILFNDITAKRHTESVLEESESLRRAFMEGIDAATLVLDMESHTVADYNSKVLELFSTKFSSEGFTGECPKFYEEVGGSQTSIFELAEESVSNEERLLDTCSGGMKPVRLFTIEAWFKNRRFKIVVIFDITRERMLERRANHIQQLEVLGDIAGSLPSMLGESSNNVQQILENLSEKQEVKHSLSEICEALEDANYINETIGALGSIVQYETEIACVDINQIVKNCVLLTKDKWHPYAEIDLNINSESKSITCCPDEMGQVFLNLLVNAAHAVRKKFEADGERGYIKLTSRYTSGFYEVKISDTGIGIKKKDLKRIFDKGYTTKEVGRVTGNGLAIVYDLVVKRHKGTIEFKSTEGKGTEFNIRLPLFAEK